MSEEYNFHISYNGVESKSPALKTHKKGIYLHFLRAGLFCNQTPCCHMDYLGEVTYNQALPLHLHQLGTHECFYDAETFLNPGYLYIIDDTHKDAKGESLYYEYQVLDGGDLAPIFWTENNMGNIRKPTMNFNKQSRFLIFPKGTVVWVAYSSVQWPPSYLGGMIHDMSKRQKRMKRIVCSGIRKGEKATDSTIVPYTQVHPRYLEYNVAFSQMLDTMKNIHCMEEAEDEAGNNDLLEDMFIILDDPMGCANDLACTLQAEYHQLDALLESIQTGEAPYYIFNRLEKKGRDMKDPTHTPYMKEQIGALFGFALSVYHLIYNDEGVEDGLHDKYGDTMKKENIEKLLAVNERKVLLEHITDLREDFGNFLSMSYYQDRLPEYTNNCDEYTYVGDYILSSHLALLSIYPYDKERFLRLEKENREYAKHKDKWIGFFKGISDEGKHKNIDDLLTKAIELSPILKHEENNDFYARQFTFSNGVDITYAAAYRMNNILEAFSKTGSLEFQFKYLKSYNYKNIPIVQLMRDEVATFGKELKGWRIAYDQLFDVENKQGGMSKNFLRLKNKLAGNGKKLSLPIRRNGSLGISKLLNSPQFGLFLVGLEVVNVVSILKADNGDKLSNKTRMKIFGSLIYFSYLIFDYSNKIMVNSPKFSDVNKFMRYATKGLRYSASGINVIACAWDTIELYRNGDHDAGVCALSVTVLSSIAFLNTIGVIALSFSAIIVVEVLILIGILLMIWLTDTDFEKFLKNNILGSNANEIIYIGEPYKFARFLFNNKNKMISDEFYELRNFKYVNLLLSDYLPCFSVKLYFIGMGKTFSKIIEGFHDELPVYVPSCVKVNCNFFEYISEEGKIEYRLSIKRFNEISIVESGVYDYMQRNKIERESSVCINNLKEGFRLVEEENNLRLELFFQLTEKELNSIDEYSTFIFESRILVGKEASKYWPQINEGKDRFLRLEYNSYTYDYIPHFKELEREIKARTITN